MGVTDAALSSPYLPFFVHAMVMASGSWPLQSYGYGLGLLATPKLPPE